MSQFPVEDQPGLYEGINYLLSGPAGLGQNFQGFADYQPAYIRPTVRQPFTLPIDTTLDPSWYVSLPITNITPIDVDPLTGKTRKIQVDFTGTFTDPPFQYGDNLDLAGVVDDGSGEIYNGPGYRVFSSTTTSVVLYTTLSYVWATYVSGGTVGREYNNIAVSTDCNSRVTIQGPTDQAFITCQIYFDFTYFCSGSTDFDVVVAINRYRGSTVPGRDDFEFSFDAVISSQTFSFTDTTDGSDRVEAIFTTVLDSPGFGYYWYINELYVYPKGGLVTNKFDVIGTNAKVYNPAVTTYAGLTPVTVTGTGSGANVNIEIFPSSDVYNYDINTSMIVNTAGTGYKVGDTIKILGTDLGGTSPENDLTMELTRVTNATNFYAGTFTAGLRSMTAQVIKE
jgi:hypothetical protein